MPAARRVNPKDLFTPEAWSRLTRRSRVRGPLLVLHAWALIGAAMALAILIPNPATILLAIMVVGARQLGLAILMHDAAHGALHPDPRVNDALARWLCAAPVGADLGRYRPYHLRHHRFAQQPEDPDLALSAPFPIDAASLRRKAVRDLTGQTFYKQRIAPTLAAFRAARRDQGRALAALPGVLGFWRDFLIANAALLLVLSLAGAAWAWPVLWLLPMATWYPLVTRIRNIAEHACVPSNEDPYRHARTTRANLLERLLLAPYYVNYHCEHHLFMHLPCWRLPEAHRLLTRSGAVARMEVKRGYLEVLRIAAGGRGGRPPPARAAPGPLSAPFG